MYEDALRENPQMSGIHLRLGAAYRRNGQLEEAISAYLRGIDVEPGNVSLYNNLSSAYGAAGQLEEALEACRKALEIDPENTRARENWAALKRFSEEGEKVDLTEP